MPASPHDSCTAYHIAANPPAHVHCGCNLAHKPAQKLADLLRTATEFDEIAGHLVDEYDLMAIELERIAALRAAVHKLNGGAS